MEVQVNGSDKLLKKTEQKYGTINIITRAKSRNWFALKRDSSIDSNVKALTSTAFAYCCPPHSTQLCSLVVPIFVTFALMS